MDSTKLTPEETTCPECGETREENFDVCWNCETVFSNTPPKKERGKVIPVKKTAGVEKINDAGESLYNIGKLLLYFFLGMLFLIIGAFFYGGANLLIYCLGGLAQIILIFRIITSLFNAGSLLKSVKREDFFD